MQTYQYNILASSCDSLGFVDVSPAVRVTESANRDPV